jgi:hypothetical protein
MRMGRRRDCEGENDITFLLVDEMFHFECNIYRVILFTPCKLGGDLEEMHFEKWPTEPTNNKGSFLK